jgi:signal transduction histidine kinase
MIAKIMSLVALAGYLALIFISLRQNGRRQVNRAFILYLSAMAFWQLAAVVVTFTIESTSALLWYRLMTAGMGGQFIFYCLFILVFVKTTHRRVATIAGWLLFVGLLISYRTDLIIKDVMLSPATGIYVPTFGKLVPMIGMITFFYLAYGVFSLIRAYRQSKSLNQRNRIRYLLVGAAVIGLGALSNLSSHTQPFPIDVTANVINAVIIAIAIGRHKLLDTSIMLRKGMLYSIPTVIIATCYFLFINLATSIFHAHGDMQIFVSFCLAVLAALIAQPVMKHAQNWVDRLFFREKYDSTQMLQRLSQTAASMLRLDSLTSLILEEVTSTIHIEKAAFFLMNDKAGDFRLAAQHGLDNQGEYLFRKDHPVIEWLRMNKALTRPEIEMLPQFKALWGREKDQLDRLDVELLIPVIAKKELVGIFTLGPKQSEEQYSPDDIRTISTLANQTAIAIENARLFWQLEGTLGTLRKTHDELEMRVQERTADLARANEALKSENLERLRAEEEIKRYTKELERSNKELQQFAYVASHDLQEPLRMVGSFLQLLERRYSQQLDSNAKDFIHYAVDGAVRMQALINDLLEYSRVGTRGKPFEEIDLNKIVALAKNNLNIAIKEHKAKIRCAKLPLIFGDDTQLTQVFQNLIGNAIKFHTEKSPEITITSVRKNGNYEIMVKDNGIGIDPQYKEKIFLIFQRLHNREDYPGTGIGLAICKRIVERHGGSIWVESKAGEGATFIFSIPAGKREPV